MTITTVSSRDLNHDIGKAKKAAQLGPVVITDRGRPAHVLLTYADYQRLIGQKRSIAEALSFPGVEDIAFDPMPTDISLSTVDFS